MKGYPGLTPFLLAQAEKMGLTELPGQRPIAMARHAKAIQLIEGHIGQAARTHTPSARDAILGNAEDHLLCIELQLRTCCMMLVDAYKRAELPVPAWLDRYKPAFDALTESDPEEVEDDEDEDDAETGESTSQDPDDSTPSPKPRRGGRRRASQS
jgi:hypothetical protein